MNLSKDKIYFQIKNRYPQLSDKEISNIHKKVLSKLFERNNLNDSLTTTSDNLISRYEIEKNLRTNENIVKDSEYIPRVRVAEFQNKIQRNEFEDNYQQFYKEREDLSNKEYYNAMVKNNNGKNFNTEDDEKREIFFKQESSRRKQFEKDQREREQQYKQGEKKRFEQFKKEMDDLNSSNINPLEIFNLPENFNLEQLKSAYKKLAMKHHPDRGGDPNKFKIISKSYIALEEKYKIRKEDKEFTDLKNDFNQFIDKQQNYQSTFKLDPDKFNIDRFNQLYEENKQFSSNDVGYGDWTTNDTSESPTQIFSDKFNLNMFNSLFNEQKNIDKNCNQVLNYNNDPLPSDKGTMMNYTDIADLSITNFSSDINSNLKYTDYKEAHTFTKLINTNNVTRKEYKSVDELEKDRGNINYQMSEADLMRYNFEKARKDEEEQIRLQKIRDQQDINEKNFNHLNKIMINNFS